MNNILNHSRESFKIALNNSEYWDFHLSMEDGLYYPEGLTERCLSAYIDFDDPDCIWFDEIKSKQRYVWDMAKNNNTILKHIGYTGIDNGRINYDKDTISRKIFYQIFFHALLDLEDDVRLKLYKVYGNNKMYDYTLDLTTEDDMQVARCNGGFYQGFYKIEGSDYMVLPSNLTNGFDFEITLKKSDFGHATDKDRLNDVHPENKGIFFYMGTRAENKWMKYYDTGMEFPKRDIWYFDSEYVKDEFYNNADYTNVNYVDDYNEEPACKSDLYVEESYMQLLDCNKCCKDFQDFYVEPGYLCSGYVTMDDGVCCNHYVKDGYIEVDEYLDEDTTDIFTDDGESFKSPVSRVEYKTDNKFLFFDRTADGYTTKTWSEDYEVVISMPTLPDIGNYFLMFNRTANGYTAKTIEKEIQKARQKYNVLKDIYRNALAFQITDDGRIGYRFAVKDCDSEEEAYKILSDYSAENIIKDDKWQVVHIKLTPIRLKHRNQPLFCNANVSPDDTMKILIYVDGKLVYMSKELPMFNFKALADYSEKQEGVPYNISIGGGTQGLCDVVYLNYLKYPEYILPLEQEFGGTFIGYIKDFKFYTCELKYNEIKNNFLYMQRFLPTNKLKTK